MKPGIVIAGGGGHGRVVADLISALACYRAVGFVDSASDAAIPGLACLGSDDDLPKLRASGVGAAALGLGVGADADVAPRLDLQRRLAALGFSFPALAHPSAVVSSSAVLGAGAQIMARCVIQARARLGAHCVVNTGSIIEHDCTIGEGAFIASGAILGGTVRVGQGAFIGLGAVILPRVAIGDDAIVAAGSVVVADVPAKARVMGVPASQR